jgi:hypothetical protein
LCSSIFPLLKSIDAPDLVAYIATAMTTVVVILLLLAFFFIDSWKKYLIRATIGLLFTISLVLCGLLYWNYFVRIDKWTVWNDALNVNVKKCEEDYQKGEANTETRDNRDRSSNYDTKVVCIGKAIKANKYPYQGEEGELKISSLENDVRAGSILISNKVVSAVLKKRLGIGNKFLGTGIAMPSGLGKVYGHARLPEYLVPNLPETHDKILTWQIPSPLPFMSRTVECLITGCIDGVQPSNIDPKVEKDKSKLVNILEYVKKTENRFNEETVILIRLNRFNPYDDKGEKRYKGNLGRDDASRVFMIRLRDVWNMSIQDALIFSGHEVDESRSNETLFVWLYVPAPGDPITPATWINIIDNIDKLFVGGPRK